MQTKLQTQDSLPTRSKLLYTAVLYDDVPESSASSSTHEAGAYSTYMKRLTREHLGRASMEEIESSICDLPDPQSKERVARLTEKVKKAYSEANGNPADGRWSFLSDLLRLNTTRSRRHWLGVRTDEKVPDVLQLACTIPKTSEEWHALERRWKEEENVKNKVKSWITTAEFEPLTPDTTAIQVPALYEDTSSRPAPSRPPAKSGDYDNRKPTTHHTLKSVSNAIDPLTNAGYGFSVVKRSRATVKDKSKVSKRPQAPLETHHADSNRRSEVSESKADDAVLGTNDITHDSQDHRPSKPCHTVDGASGNRPFTSSLAAPPGDAPGHIEKPAPIPFVGSLPSPTSSPRATRTYGLPQNPASSPSLTSHRTEPSSSVPLGDGQYDGTGISRKRTRSESPEGKLEAKRQRKEFGDILPSLQLPSHDHANLSAIPSPATPPLKNLPKLTELLTSNKQGKRTPSKKAPIPKLQANVIQSPEDQSDPLPHPHHNLSGVSKELTTGAMSPESGEVKAKSSDSVQGPIPGPVYVSTANKANNPSLHRAQHSEPETSAETDLTAEFGAGLIEVTGSALAEPDAELSIADILAVQASPPQSPETPIPVGSASPHPLLRTPPSLNSPNLGFKMYSLYGLDDSGNPSPTKSLSSLAGSDSESDPDDEGERVGERLLVPEELDLENLEFNPPFTSTQKPNDGDVDLYPPLASEVDADNPGLDLGSGWGHEKLHSTSQLQAEVNSQVDEFDKFMEADLGYDLIATGL